MRTIVLKFWQEPSVVVGLLLSLAAFACTLFPGFGLDAAGVALILAPLVTSLGVRPLVYSPQTV